MGKFSALLPPSGLTSVPVLHETKKKSDFFFSSVSAPFPFIFVVCGTRIEFFRCENLVSLVSEWKKERKDVGLVSDVSILFDTTLRQRLLCALCECVHERRFIYFISFL
jgi:hypothetical protein